MAPVLSPRWRVPPFSLLALLRAQEAPWHRFVAAERAKSKLDELARCTRRALRDEPPAKVRVMMDELPLHMLGTAPGRDDGLGLPELMAVLTRRDWEDWPHDVVRPVPRRSGVEMRVERWRAQWRDPDYVRKVTLSLKSAP
jgi:hypothetical protein